MMDPLLRFLLDFVSIISFVSGAVFLVTLIRGSLFSLKPWMCFTMVGLQLAIIVLTFQITELPYRAFVQVSAVFGMIIFTVLGEMLRKRTTQ